MLQLPQPLHGLIRSHLSTKDAMALAAASTELLDLHRLGARHLTLRARPAASDPPPLQALASLLARQRASALRGLKVRVVAGVAAYPPAGRAAAAAVAAAAGDNNDEAPMLPMPNAFSAWPAAVGPPTGAGDLMLISEDEASDAEDGLPSTLAPASAPSMLFPPPLGLPPLPCLPAVVTLVLEAAEEGDDEEEANGNGDDDEEGRRFKRGRWVVWVDDQALAPCARSSSQSA